jgi:hypothetical protein
MANTGKEERVRKLFIVRLVEEKKYIPSRLASAFETCWAKVPDGLKKKLNSTELFEYIRLHIVPTADIPVFGKEAQYGITLKTPHTKDFYA